MWILQVFSDGNGWDGVSFGDGLLLGSILLSPRPGVDFDNKFFFSLGERCLGWVFTCFPLCPIPTRGTRDVAPSANLGQPDVRKSISPGKSSDRFRPNLVVKLFSAESDKAIVQRAAHSLMN